VAGKERNELVVAEAVKAHRYGLSVMALVQHTAHGDLLKHMLTLAGLRVRFISGECDHATRIGGDTEILSSVFTGRQRQGCRLCGNILHRTRPLVRT
jgi:hypothetical protein